MSEKHFQESGSWSSGSQASCEESFSYSTRLKELAERLKTQVTQQRIAAVLPTPDLRRAFGSITADTFSLYGIAILEKQTNVLEIQEKKFLNQDIIKNLPTIYIGAGVDVEYPLTLGARDIIMVDPELKNTACFERLRQKIKNITGGKYSESNCDFNFEFDFGNGPEKVFVKTDPRAYAEKDSISGENRFIPPKEIALLLSFQSEDPTTDKEVLDNLTAGGYIIANRLLSRFSSEYFAQSEWSEQFGNASPAEKCSMLDSLYREKGFDSVRLKSFEEDYNQTFLRKV